jgi:thioredoxin-related protein
MKPLLFAPLLTLILLLGAGCGGPAASKAPKVSTWATTWEAASAEAKSSGKPILIAFTRHDASPWSGRMKTEIFESEQFFVWAAQHVVLLNVDFSDSPGAPTGPATAKLELAQKYEVVGFPTVVFSDADGKALGSLRYHSGGAGAWIQEADQILAGKQPHSLPWLHVWEQAAKQSKASGKPVLMDFTGSDWCVFCIKLKEEVFETEAFRKWAAEKVVLMEVDFPRNFDLDPALLKQNEGLAAQYGVRGFPTIVFVDHSGKLIGSLGYAQGGPDVWLKKANAELSSAPQASASPVPSPSSQP